MRLPAVRLTGRVLTSLCVAILSGCARLHRWQCHRHRNRWDIHAGGGTYLGSHPSVSPDGLSIVYSTPATGHGDIYRFDRTTGKHVRLTTGPRVRWLSPLLEGRQAHYLRARDERHLPSLCHGRRRQEPEAAHGRADIRLRGLILDGWTDDRLFPRPRWRLSPLVDECRRGNPRPLTDGPWFDSSPSLSPDGGRIVFKRREKGQIYLTPPRDEEALSAGSPRSM